MAKWRRSVLASTHLLLCLVSCFTLQQRHDKQKCAYRCRIVCKLLGDCFRHRRTEIATRPNRSCDANPHIHRRSHYHSAIHTKPISMNKIENVKGDFLRCRGHTITGLRTSAPFSNRTWRMFSSRQAFAR